MTQERIMIRIKGKCEIRKGSHKRSFEKGDEVIVDLDVFTELMKRGLCVPAGMQYGAPIDMNE